MYHRIAAPMHPERCPGDTQFDGLPVSPADAPLQAVPTTLRQRQIDTYIEAFARATGLYLAHELGHALGVPNQMSTTTYPDCTDPDIGHNSAEAPGAPVVPRDTRHDPMDAQPEWIYFPETGMVDYVEATGEWIAGLPIDIARFTDDECHADDQFCQLTCGPDCTRVFPFSLSHLEANHWSRP